ncbi:MAG: TAXI family TRAP transporter solute-binding subunit, partial [Beijerinckiaceae bacterium]
MRKFLLAVAGLAMAASPAAAQKYNLTVAGYSPGGLVSTIGIGMDKALAAQFPGSAVTYQTSSGGLANAVLVASGKTPLGFIGDHEMAVIVNGRPPFKKPITSLRLLFRPYTGGSRFQVSHVLVRKDFAEKHGLKTFADLAAKKPPIKLALNRPGNNDSEVSLAMLKQIGVTQDDIKKWGGQIVRAASREQTSLMLDRRIDGLIFGISYNHPRVREIAKGVDVVMLPITKEVAEKAAEEWSSSVCSFKASEYEFLATDSYSVCVGSGTYVNEKMDDATAYNVTKAMFEQLDKYQSAHRLLAKAVTAQTLAEKGPAPWHPGA